MSESAKQRSIEAQINDESLRIEFFTTELPLEVLAERLQREDLYVPDYQREFNWTIRTRSRFIESLLLRLPIPFLFFWEAENGKLEIVDGSQRIRTVYSFIHDQLRLDRLDRLTSCSGVIFSDLPLSIQRKFLNTTIRGIVMGSTADLSARRDMFNRINTSALQAKPAEIRRGVNAGPFLDLILVLAQHPTFESIAPMTSTDKGRRLDEELIARFFGYSTDLADYRDNPRDYLAHYTDGMNRRLTDTPSLEQEMKMNFTRAVDFVNRVFPYGVRKKPGGKKTYTARFEAIVIGSHLALQVEPELIRRNPDVLSWLESDEFEDIVSSDAANVKSKLLRRIGYVRDHLLSEQ